MCEQEAKSGHIAEILKNIPRSDEEPKTLAYLCPAATSDAACRACFQSVLTVLDIFDAITRFPGPSGEIKVKAQSQTALYFLRSLAIYIQDRLKLVAEWERTGGIGIEEKVPLEQAITPGARFIYIMEHRRVNEYAEESPIRQVDVSQCLIKARVRGHLKQVYLVQYDPRAQQYQLIGGRKRRTDEDETTVMKRELQEELAASHLQFARDYTLQQLASGITITELSRTYGAYSEYHFTFFQAFIKRRQLDLGPNDRWVTAEELKRERTRDGKKVAGGYLRILEEAMSRDIHELPLSLDETQTRPWLEVFRERPLEWIGVLLGVLGIIVSIIVFLVECFLP